MRVRVDPALRPENPLHFRRRALPTRLRSSASRRAHTPEAAPEGACSRARSRGQPSQSDTSSQSLRRIPAAWEGASILLPGHSPDRDPRIQRRTLVQIAPQESVPSLVLMPPKRRVRSICAANSPAPPREANTRTVRITPFGLVTRGPRGDARVADWTRPSLSRRHFEANRVATYFSTSAPPRRTVPGPLRT